ncbi:putative lipoprotein [Leptospira fainei serovar Hurstbridge str. BUT 6]|uniref:Lipoprotein n=1 Tax=Leptospira fainei serovar Hurstbridge str. BUT 6 TaxID=1193011 RepID=S3W740_9LEPT|nr:hypothetical protein [Leptospira fainei]EPG75937.1 putative lipoprotein [Leptospira fainei serovar Hurstbridge str. BUT 6]
MSFKNKVSLILIALGFTLLFGGCSKSKSDDNGTLLLDKIVNQSRNV